MSSSAPAIGWYRQAQRALLRTVRTRLRRRIWVACMYAALLGGDGVAIGLKLRLGIVPAFSVAFLIAALSLQAMQLIGWWARSALRRHGPAVGPPSVFGVTPGSSLDERETAVRDRAFRRAYVCVTAMAGAAGVAALILNWNVPGLFRALTGDLLCPLLLFAAALQFLVSLPAAFLAWTEPDDDLRIEPAAESAP